MVNKLPPVICVALFFALSSSAFGVILYDSTQSPLPGNVPSLGYQATSTAEFGDHVQPISGSWFATSATVTMSDWAVFADYPTMNPAGWQHPLTLNIYSVDNSAAVPAVGALIHSGTVLADIPWHDPSNGFSGTAFNVDFALPDVPLPSEFIFGLSYNTQTHGENPIGTPGPYNSLNFGLNSAAPPTTGTDVNNDAVFWNTTFAGFYTDGGASGVGTFRQDTVWSPFVPAILIQGREAPEPASLGMFAVCLAGCVLWRRRRARCNKA